MSVRLRTQWLWVRVHLQSLNNPSLEKKNNDHENVVNFKYYDTDQIQTVKFPKKHKSLALFHINTWSWPNDELDHLLKCTSKVFHIIAVTETRITKQTSLLILAWEIMPLSLLLLNLQLGACSFTLLVTCLINLIRILVFIKPTS